MRMKYINIRFFIFLLFTVFFFGANAQEVLTKEEAVKLTLMNNLGIQISENNAQIAENNAGILNSGYLPTVTGNGAVTLDKRNTEGELADGSIRAADGVETRNYSASVNVNYILFDGLGRLYNYKSLKEQSELSELEVRETIESTILQLFSVYYEVARLEENNSILNEALDISKERLQRAQYQFDYGQNTGLDILNAEVDVNTDSINLLNSEQQLRNTKRDLNLVMSRELSTTFKIDTLVSFVAGLQMEEMYRNARENNVVVKQMEKNINISEYNYKANKGSFLPSIGLTGSYGWNESTNTSPLAFTVQTTATGLSAGLNLTWNLFDGGRTITAVKNAKITYENQELFKEQVLLEVERDIKNAWETYMNALYVLQAQEKNVATNLNNFTRTEERYKIGRSNSIEFRQAQINLLNASLSRNQAKYTAKLAELQALQVSGQLLNIQF